MEGEVVSLLAACGAADARADNAVIPITKTRWRGAEETKRRHVLKISREINRVVTKPINNSIFPPRVKRLRGWLVTGCSKVTWLAEGGHAAGRRGGRGLYDTIHTPRMKNARRGMSQDALQAA